MSKFFRGRTPGPLALREAVKGGGNVGRRRGKWKDVAGKGGKGQGRERKVGMEAPAQNKNYHYTTGVINSFTSH